MAVKVQVERTADGQGSGKPSPAKLVLAGLVGAVLALIFLPDISITLNGDGDKEEIDPGIPPAEFLYLDNDRVAAYLAQLEGGLAKSERLTRTLTTGVTGKAAGGGLFEVGASAQEQRFVEREVTPTAASNYFRLLDQLADADEEAVRLRELDQTSLDGLRELAEGRFVRFETEELLSPDYIRPYLVVRQASTLAALLPLASDDPGTRAAVEKQRNAAKGFARQVGPNPRMTFALEASVNEGQSEGENIRYLLPMQYEQLTDERSLIKNGGGDFTVVGKVVRIFERPDPDEAPYVDSPTRETWLQPLRQAPTSLVRRSSRGCESEPGTALRTCLLDALDRQTVIPALGGVIIPIAIYK